jgi:DNA-binding transcriptional ArsR family regulator
MTADVLGRSRFAIAPAHEVANAVRFGADHPMSHAREWYVQAARTLPRQTIALLDALIPDDHEYLPDFLFPPPAKAVETIDEQVHRISNTPPEIVEHHLDIALRGRRVRPDVLALFDDEREYERWRRPVPVELAQLIERGPAAVVAAAAEAVARFFEVAVQPTWPKVRAVLERDIERRSDRMAFRGAIAMIDDLGTGVQWDRDGVVLDRPYEMVVDWAAEGLLLVPSTTHVGRVNYSAERPLTPMIVYPADGTARLWERPRLLSADRSLASLLGPTRAALLSALGDASSTTELSEQLFWSEPTVSYHLKILFDAGLVERARRGRRVLYRRTDLGSSLIDGARHTAP